MTNTLGRLVAFTLIAFTSISCTPAQPLGVTVPSKTYQSKEVSKGVVNGLWQHDPTGNAKRLKGVFAGASPDQAQGLLDRYQVRVGINRSWFLGEAHEVVVLPQGWTYSLEQVVDDGQTVNIGDVVQMRGQPGTNFEVVEKIVRKCNATPLPGENKDWNIGCKTVAGFDSHGFGGDKSYWSSF